MDVGAGARQTLLMVLAAIYVPLSFTTVRDTTNSPHAAFYLTPAKGIFGMNLSEINQSLPHLWHVLMLGLPLAVLTALLPLYFNSLWRFSYRTLPLLRQAFQTPSADKVLMCLNLALFVVTIVLCGTSTLFHWGPVVGFVAWALFACFVSWIRQSRLFWAHWFASMLVLLILVLLAFEQAAIWSLLPIFGYWILRDWLSLKAFFAAVRSGLSG